MQELRSSSDFSRVKIASPFRPSGSEYRRRPWIKFVRDIIFVVLSGGAFERQIQQPAYDSGGGGGDRDGGVWQRRRVMSVRPGWVQFGGVAYGFIIAFFTSAFLIGTIFHLDCARPLSLFLVLTNGGNCVASAAFCVFTYDERLGRLVLYLVFAANAAALSVGAHILTFPQRWEYRKNEHEMVTGDLRPGVAFCRPEPFYAAMATMAVLAAIVAMQTVYALLLLLDFIKERSSKSEKMKGNKEVSDLAEKGEISTHGRKRVKKTPPPPPPRSAESENTTDSGGSTTETATSRPIKQKGTWQKKPPFEKKWR